MDAEKHQKVKAIFIEAIDLKPREREAYIRQASKGDTEILEELRTLLANHSEETIMVENSGNATDTASRKKPRQHLSPKLSDTTFTKRSVIWMERLFGTRQRFGITLIVTFVLLIVLGYWSHRQVKNSLEEIRREQLQAVLDADVVAMQYWIRDFRNSVRFWCNTPEVSDEIHYILRYRNSPEEIERLQFSPWQDTLTGILRPYLKNTNSAGYNLFDEAGYEFAASDRSVIGNRLNPAGFRQLFEANAREGTFKAPFDPNKLVYDDYDVRSIYSKPIVWAGNPIYNKIGELIGYFGVGRYADEGFSEIVNVARMGKTGETYAFNAEGMMLTESRFVDQLKSIGLVPNKEEAGSSLVVSLRDPGGDLTEGYKPTQPLISRNFTEPVALSIASKSDSSIAITDVLIDPYRDYRGVKVIGAYHWFPEFGFGLVTEVDYEEAFEPLIYLDATFGILILILAVVLTYSLYSSLRYVRLNRKVGEAAQLGQYTMVRKIGEGGIGEVYLAHHAMLKRPTAIKILKPNIISAEVVERFEREVQLASRLTHPNTIEIYDFGRTPDGIFYYAMELLNGFTLAQIVQMQGELPFERALHILRQASASIREAHSIGLIHRDIKPQNIMLVQRGGEDDVVKVLDFGLVKDLSDEEAAQTRTTQVTGTPLYMAPERIKTPKNSDLRSDIYALGAVAYYMLAGQSLFRFSTEIDIMFQVINTEPDPLHEINTQVPQEVSDLIHRCLEKDPEKRPQTARELHASLKELSGKYPWDSEKARKWWSRFE
ncbi:serine/threonine protein kinase [Phaeocystidibacter marisrubri]|uniref:Serine/threonine protein kinase n=1 Tax=Phaeocystidibacter marisrubri TaxID=1577780 RepID=A0A6L3ZCD1_9FLAO|nr:serine/threonine protein kinase [Phaeocystidibacter marisrubri]KAB2815101.1 serine/threonine protein kinase [Phaeocystidibacter marisrubri]GGH70313.1 serine/threonine protein kinase [Phaeocystidibacter marisrubri]